MHKIFLLFLFFIILYSCNTTLSEKEVAAYKEKGLTISKSTGKELSGILMTKMKEGGISQAITFCNVTAIPITQQMSENYDVTIKRTSLKTRNPLNAPAENERFILKEFDAVKRNELPLESKVLLDVDGNPHYYAPIFVENKCLICHGTLGKELSKTTDSIIKSHYPNDLAIGFKEGDLRGIWSISFAKPKS